MVRPSGKTKMHLVDREIRQALGARIADSIQKHPKGVGIRDLRSELGEVFEAARKGDRVSLLHELYDAAAVAIRLIEIEEEHREKEATT